jgi:NADPH:quinone reductase-like Zn-dependent oxidoreductase
MPWDLLVNRSDLTDTALREVPAPDLAVGEVLLRVGRVGVTANNVTYALFGDAMHYWDFFPTGEPQWGRVPLWGFAEVEQSSDDAVPVGTRLFGYLPTSSHLVVRPGKADARGFRDLSEHRQHLPSPYNRLTTAAADPSYDPAFEDLQVLFRPLFMTSYMLADFLVDNGLFGARQVIVSSASSKTSYGAAHLLRQDATVVGLTSKGNVDFTQSLGCYDRVLTYEQVAELPREPAVYVDVAGDAELRRQVHTTLGEHLRHSAVVGAAHASTAPSLEGPLPGPRPAFFFAPDQMRKRQADWGPDGVEEGHAQAWAAFRPVVQDWVDVVVGNGAEDLQAVWLEVLAGRTPPRVGHTIQL